MVNRRLAWMFVFGLASCEELPRTYSSGGATTELFHDDFNRDTLGPNWTPTGEGANIVDGQLVAIDLHNHPVWLAVELPDDFRVELDVIAASEEGDVKIELAGDGKSFDGDGGNYQASGYVFVFGGWNNTRSIIARQDEHGRAIASVDEPKVEPGRRYHFVITRVGGEIRWEVDGRLLLEYVDEKPLRGHGQRHLALSGWEAEAHFDNLRVTSVSSDS